MSPLAIIVAAAFWTLIWGAPGLLLATPITACLVVLGRHVESLNFIELLLGDKPPLSPVQSFYQRILASDPDEVSFQAEALLKTMPLLEYYQDVALPALALAQIDVTRGVLERSRQVDVASIRTGRRRSFRSRRCREYGRGSRFPPPLPATMAPVAGEEQSLEKKNGVLCIAGRTPLDQAGCAILVQLLERRSVASASQVPKC